MSFPDPPPPLQPVMQPPFSGGLWPQSSGSDEYHEAQSLMNSEYSDLQSHFEHLPPFKRPRDFENNQPLNPRVNPLNPLNLSANKGTTHIFYKTRMCQKFLDGTCRNGDSCTFAHGVEDLREPPPNWQELIREKDKSSGNWNDDQRMIHRMKICRKFYNGEECPYGEKCNFAHKSPSECKINIARPRESSAISIGTTGPLMGNSDQLEVNKHANANSEAFRVKPWKTKLCTKWSQTGQCSFGENCFFAHGESELQVPTGRFEADMMTNTSSVLAKTLPVYANDASSTAMVVGTSFQEDGGDKKSLLKWKVNKKINCIYADWIDDLTSSESLPSNMEG